MQRGCACDRLLLDKLGTWAPDRPGVGRGGAGGARKVGGARAQGRAFQEGRVIPAVWINKQARDPVIPAVVHGHYWRDYYGAQWRVVSALPRLVTSQPDSGSVPLTLGYNSFLSIF